MNFEVISLFPEMFAALRDFGVTGRAIKSGLVQLGLSNPRDYAMNKHNNVDDKPYGGGPGMVMQVAPLRAAIKAAQKKLPTAPVIYLSPQGQRLTQAKAESLSKLPAMILLAGRYEGIDQRIIDQDVDECISVGDYVLSGGELPAMILMDAVMRLVPGVLGDDQSAEVESFQQGLLDHPHYTRPEEIDGQRVPEVLLSGNHAEVEKWRAVQRMKLTQTLRPDLLDEI
jgi:tRNA (guanine37-N1)-methyltransferase